METLALSWWLWLLLGLALLAGELLTPGGFYLIFFGAGAMLIGALKLIGFDWSLPTEILLFVVASVAGLLFFRKPLLQRFRRLTPQIAVDALTSEIACSMEEIPAGAVGKVELRGTSWNAHNLDESTIPKAARCRVERVDGLTLHVRKI
ncbi:MAG: NfeD family protein [Acidobacteria bacterium]|nr:NfeD family protein [Acidobacteriota bacterium]